MLTIRREQMEALEEAQKHQFALEMVEHLHSYSPTHAARIGDPELYQVARSGLARAEQYGLTLRGPVRLFIELMVLLGSHFDTDPQYPWAAEILNDRSTSDEMTRANVLQERAVNFYDTVLGPDYQYEHAAIRRLHAEDFEGFPEQDATAFRAELLRRLGGIYPEKSSYVGTASLTILLDNATQLANYYSMGTPAGVALVTALGFALDYRCDIDPQFPWIAQDLALRLAEHPIQLMARVRGDFLGFLRYGSTHNGAPS
jgi:hypothetical protein